MVILESRFGWLKKGDLFQIKIFTVWLWLEAIKNPGSSPGFLFLYT
jgi:hypothetical protein